MLEHHMDIDPSYQELQDQLNGMQKTQITQEIVANEEKEQKIKERQTKILDETKELNKAQEIEKDFQKWYENVNEIIKTNETNQIQFTPYTEEGEEEKFKNDINYAKKLYQREAKENNGDFIIMTNATKDNVREVYNQYRKEYDEIEQEYYSYHYNHDNVISKERQREIAQETLKKMEIKQETTIKNELNPQEKQELAEDAIKNVNENERFKEYYGLDDELKANQKAQEEKIKEFQKEMDELDKQYGQGQYYKPNWTFGDDTKQTKQENSKEEQEDPNKLSPEEEARRKEYLEKRKELELKQEKEMKKLKNEEDNIKAKMNDTTIAITTCGDFEELIKNLKQLDAALIALNKNKEEQIKEEQRQREEHINLALKDDPLMQKIVGGMLKEQKEKQEELKKEQEEMNLAKEQANYLSKKVDDMQQTNNPNAKKSFAEDIEKTLKNIDETKNLEKKKEKTPAEEQKIKEIKKLEEHYGKTIERARKELEKYKKEQIKQQEQNKKQEQTQGVTR